MNLLDRIKSKDIKVGIYGLGYVGLPLLLRFCAEDVPVIGFDVDKGKVAKLNDGVSYIETIPSSQVQKYAGKNFTATTDFSQTSEVDFLIICVPTPLNKYREPDLSYVVSTIDSALPYLRAGQTISLESTTYPGTTKEVLAPKVEGRGFKIGKDFHLVYSPEREDPGRKDFNTKSTPKVCGGITPECLEVGKALYQLVIDNVVPVSSPTVAEMTKLLENIHRAVNIGLVNELKIVCERMGIDIFEVIDAAATKPFGFVPYYPGPGIGGHCIPVDPFYLTWKAREFGLHTRFIELAGEVNGSMPNYVIAQLGNALNNREKSIKGSKVLLLGMAYKKNVDDMRESPSLEIFLKLKEMGANVDFNDPHIPQLPVLRKHPDMKTQSVSIEAKDIQKYDAVLLLTEHDQYDLTTIQSNAKLIIDTRGAFDPNLENIVRA